ncbi:hypothetical protein [Gracilimonas tropica]|uniref:hypothetical protein n=1 Tax=Gracilimonas tropica TaxID=454600 RepID=UPI00039B3100|nr:hypothetical protein [Gracilimonas tropica]
MDHSATALLNDIENPPLNGEHRVMKKVQGRGRPPLDAYMEPEETEEIAVTAQRIQENYPFFGTLLKEENGLFRRKEVISRKSPQTIEQIEQRFGGGKYQVRLKLESGTEEQIHFFIPETRQEASQLVQSPEDRNFMDSIRREVREETREEFQEIIESMERRLKSKDGELDDLTGKVRRLTLEAVEAERKSTATVREETERLQNKIEDLKEEIQDLKFENFELQQELKYADVDTGFDFKEILKDAVKSPELMQIIAPFAAKFTQAAQATGAAPTLSAPRANPQFNQHEAGLNDTSSEPEKTAENEAQPEAQNQTEQERMQYLVNQFSSTVIQTIASAMVNDQPGPDKVKQVINEGLRGLQSNGLQAQPGLWIQISRSLIDVALNNSVSAQKAAETIMPVLAQLDGAADKLKYFPADAATNFLIDHFKIEVTPEQKQFLTEVLKAFKKQIK